jgi:hypothetical protein
MKQNIIHALPLRIIPLFLIAVGVQASAHAQQLGETISGRSFLAIRAALPELERRNLKSIESYKISVSKYDSSIIVGFSDPNAPAGAMGDAGSFPALEVELSQDDLRVIRSHFVR